MRFYRLAQLLIQQNLLLSEIPFRQALTSKKDPVMLLAVLNSPLLYRGCCWLWFLTT